MVALPAQPILTAFVIAMGHALRQVVAPHQLIAQNVVLPVKIILIMNVSQMPVVQK
jgi:hypothetical protein